MKQTSKILGSNKKKLIDLQKKSYKNFYLTNKYICKKIDYYRSKLLDKKSNSSYRQNLKSKLKISSTCSMVRATSSVISFLIFLKS